MKKYLGDGIYVDLDVVGRIVLTTSDGINVTNKIVLEQDVAEAFVEYFNTLNNVRV